MRKSAVRINTHVLAMNLDGVYVVRDSDMKSVPSYLQTENYLCNQYSLETYGRIIQKKRNFNIPEH